MFYVINLIVIVMILLIGYWWANQGLFSAILHLLCVIAAGALAFALWEPIVVNYLLTGGWFDSYAWGVTLVGLFAVFLLLFRLAFDRLAPANVALPNWANLTFGFVAGAAAGVITTGIFLIGAGYIHTEDRIFEFRGFARSQDRVQQVNALWAPAHEWTNHFYEWLSVGSLSSATPLRHYNPRLDQMATLIRDGYTSRGRLVSRVGMDPAGISVEHFEYVPDGPDGPRYAVVLNVQRRAFDAGEQFILAQSQIRIIAPPPAGSRQPASIAHPDVWTQPDGDSYQYFRFNNPNQYATSVQGREQAIFRFEFPVGQGNDRIAANRTPRYVQVKGVRYRLPAPLEVNQTVFYNNRRTAGQDTRVTTVEHDPRAIMMPASEISVSPNIVGMVISVNAVGRQMELSDNLMVSGRLRVPPASERPPPNLRVNRIFEPERTRVVQVSVSLGSAGDLQGPLARQAGQNARIYLVDRQGNRYTPIGYVIREPNQTVVVHLDPGRGFETIGQVPPLPPTGDHEMSLIFRVTEGSRLVRMMFDEVTAANIDVYVEPR